MPSRPQRLHPEHLELVTARRYDQVHLNLYYLDPRVFRKADLLEQVSCDSLKVIAL